MEKGKLLEQINIREGTINKDKILMTLKQEVKNLNRYNKAIYLNEAQDLFNSLEKSLDITIRKQKRNHEFIRRGLPSRGRKEQLKKSEKLLKSMTKQQKEIKSLLSRIELLSKNHENSQSLKTQPSVQKHLIFSHKYFTIPRPKLNRANKLDNHISNAKDKANQNNALSKEKKTVKFNLDDRIK